MLGAHYKCATYLTRKTRREPWLQFFAGIRNRFDGIVSKNSISSPPHHGMVFIAAIFCRFNAILVKCKFQIKMPSVLSECSWWLDKMPLQSMPRIYLASKMARSIKGIQNAWDGICCSSRECIKKIPCAAVTRQAFCELSYVHKLIVMEMPSASALSTTPRDHCRGGAHTIVARRKNNANACAWMIQRISLAHRFGMCIFGDKIRENRYAQNAAKQNAATRNVHLEDFLCTSLCAYTYFKYYMYFSHNVIVIKRIAFKKTRCFAKKQMS